MKRVIRILSWVSLFLCVAIAALAVKMKLGYGREFDAFRDAIDQRGDLAVVDQWRHEDITLEDFGFLIWGRTGEFWIDINDDTRVRMPDDHVAGLLVQIGDGEGQRAISIDSPYWETAGLPRITSARDFLQNAETIIAKLKETPPAVTNLRVGFFAEYSLYLRVRLPKMAEQDALELTTQSSIPAAQEVALARVVAHLLN